MEQDSEIDVPTHRLRGNCAKDTQIPVFISTDMKERDVNKGDTTAVLTFPTADRKPEQLMVINDPHPF
jgi:hypothetical protein